VGTAEYFYSFLLLTTRLASNMFACIDGSSARVGIGGSRAGSLAAVPSVAADRILYPPLLVRLGTRERLLVVRELRLHLGGGGGGQRSKELTPCRITNFDIRPVPCLPPP
jgi:hypothetical protein